MNVEEALRRAGTILSLPFIERPRLEAEKLLGEALGKERVWLHTHDKESLPLEAQERFEALLQRRAQGEPLEYILGRVSFYSREFYIAKGALIPRPETEILIDLASKLITERNITRVAEVGVGSGIIACTLALLHPQVRFEASDISPEALRIARKNRARLGLEDRVILREGSLLEPLEGEFELLLSNPPYIAANTPLPKPLAYEPASALFGGERGSEILEALLAEAPRRAIPLFIAEMGFDQREPIARFMEHRPHRSLRFYKDLSGLDRGFIVEF